MVVGATLSFGTGHAYSKRDAQRSLCEGASSLLVVIKLEVGDLQHKRVSFGMIPEDGVEVRSFW